MMRQFISSNNIDSLFNNLNADLADLADWFKANKLALNVNKSNYLLFLSSDVLQTGGDRELVIGLEKIKQINVFVQIFRNNN